MLGTFVNIFKIPDLKKKILFTVAMLCIYRIGFAIPVPGFDQGKFVQAMGQQDSSSVCADIARHGDRMRARDAEDGRSPRLPLRK
jgi:preprotein translocase subunit SecY